MSHKMIKTLLLTMLLAISQSSQAESLKEFLRKTLVNTATRDHFHEDSKYLIQIGDAEQTMTYPQLAQYFEVAKLMTKEAEVLDFEILSEFEQNGIVSVVSRARVRLKMGATSVVGESVSHDILRRNKDSFLSIFNYTKQ